MPRAIARRSRFATLAAAVITASALIGSALPSGAAPPTVANPYPQAGMTDYGVCYGLSVGAARGPVPRAGLTLSNQAVSISVKGVPTTTADAAVNRVGGCLLDAALGVHSTAPAVLKFAAKITSPSVDCQLNDLDASERPFMGKVMWALDSDDDGSVDAKISGYVRIVGTDSSLPEMAWVTGMVIKGDAVGATIGGEIFFAPIFKFSAVGKFYLDTPQQNWEQLTPLGTDTARAVSTGYGYSSLNAYYYGNCGGFGDILGIPNVTSLMFGAGIESPLGHTSQGFHFLI